MLINSKDKLAGVQLIAVRNFLRAQDGTFTFWSVETVQRELDLTPDKAKRFVNTLLKREYIEAKNIHEDEYYTLTNAGRTLACASAAKPVRRKVAEKRLAELIERMQQVENDENYLYRVQWAAVFGSFLTDKELLGDVDIYFKLERKISDGDEFIRMNQERVAKAERKGRHFSTYIEQLCWSYDEVKLFLKSRSRTLELHYEDPVINQVKYQIIFGRRPD
jgi:DNA-binding MarR family transcriptional regulator